MANSLDGRRVTVVLYSFQTGGSERLGADLAAWFAARGAHCDVCATHGSDGPIRRWLMDKGIETQILDSPRTKRVGRMWKLYWHLRRTRCEVLHVHHFNMLVSTIIPAKLARVQRIVLTEHTDEELRSSEAARRVAVRYGRHVDALSAVHAGISARVAGLLQVPVEEISVIPNGVDTKTFRPRVRESDKAAAVRSSGKPLVVGCVGRLHPDKDYSNLIRAVEVLTSEGSATFAVTIVGEGPERGRLEAEVAEKGLGEFVRFLGERSDVAEIYRTFDIFVIPSKTEGLPIALLEAMSSGLPCIATDVGGVRMALDQGAGMVVDPRDSTGLARALGALISNPDLRHSLGQTARERAVREFDRMEMLVRYESLLFGDVSSG